MTAQTRHIKVNQIYYDYKPKNAEPCSVTPPVALDSDEGEVVG